IAGNGSGLATARAWVESHGMSEWVDLPGRLPREDLRELYSRADLYLNPAVLEAFPVSGLEARAAGLVVLARAGSGAAEQFEDGVSGVAAPSDEALAGAIVRLARDPDELERLRAGNREQPPPFDWPTVVNHNAAAYAAAIELVHRTR
ncbi:MAG: glycosyltransferase, partial [bacterium]|nr:glycosyltransferase [bacterium]